MSLPARRLSNRLSALAIGQRFWFWLCADALVPMAISTMADDPDSLLLSHEVGRIWRPRGAEAVFGIGDVSPSGRITLAAQEATGAQLRALAKWVTENVEADPVLARLSGASLLRVDERLAVQKRFDKPALWGELPVAPAKGTAQAAAAILEALPINGSAWLWAALADNGETFLVVNDSVADPDTADTKRLIRTTLSRGITPEQILMGPAIRRKPGVIMLRTRSEAGPAVLRALQQAWPELPVLRQLRIKMQDATDLSSEMMLLVNMSDGDRLWFAFSEEEGGSLSLSAERDGLRERAQTIGQGAPLGRGRLYLDPRGWFELQIREPAPTLLAAFAGWVTENQVRWPVMKRLSGTRLTVHDADGNVIERQRDESLWI